MQQDQNGSSRREARRGAKKEGKGGGGVMAIVNVAFRVSLGFATWQAVAAVQPNAADLHRISSPFNANPLNPSAVTKAAVAERNQLWTASLPWNAFVKAMHLSRSSTHSYEQIFTACQADLLGFPYPTLHLQDPADHAV